MGRRNTCTVAALPVVVDRSPSIQCFFESPVGLLHEHFLPVAPQTLEYLVRCNIVRPASAPDAVD
jgi:hypothetical protein